MNKDILLFMFDGYYPEGGWADFVESFYSRLEAEDYVRNNGGRECYQIVYEQRIIMQGNTYELYKEPSY